MSDLFLPNKDIINIDRTIQTDIFNYRSSEFFINMKESDIPPKGHPDRADFVKWEREKCRIGLTVGGVYIPGNLYFHFNHFYLIGDDGEDESGRTQNAAKIATLRDNDWIIHTEYARAVKEKKGYCLASSRQLGKTSCLTSLTLREVSLYENAEAMLIFGSLQDKQSFTKKIKVGIEHGQPFIIRTPIDKDWSNKTEIRFGYTNKDNTTVEKARIFLYNVDGGTDTEKGAGKALVHGSKVYYKDRVGNIEDCKIGDKIYGRDGKLTTITGVYPQGIVDIYQITFRDGRMVKCCKEHLWEVEKISKLNIGEEKVKVVNTEYLLKNHKRMFFNSKGNKTIYRNTFRVKKHECLEYEYKEINLNPYYLGLWLGDGTTNSLGQITTIDKETIVFLKNYAEQIEGILTQKNLLTYQIQDKSKSKGKPSPITTLGKKYNLRKNKHIPLEYLYNSKEIRLEVLRGILDSDAHIDKKGRIELTLSDKRLADDSVFLIRSLGINCSVTEKVGSYKKNGIVIKCKTVYRIYLGIVTEERLFNLTRKVIAQKSGNIKWSIQNGTSIEEVEYYGKGKATCISVDNKDKMFLTDNFIPTHNTVSFFAMDEALKHGSKIYYEDREDVIENVKVGDKIFGKNGELTTVLEVHPQGITDIYKITLKDGRTVESSGNHLWYVYDVGTKKYKTISTEQMFKTNNLKQIDKRYDKIVKKQRYFLPKNDSINYPEKHVLIEPYYLGLFLGDGSKDNVGNICNIDEPIIEYLKSYAERLGGELISRGKNHQIRFKGLQKRKEGSYILRKFFNHYNLHRNKHIPKDYLYNSKEIRLEILKGLMDSDGTVYKDGHIEFSNTDYPLIKQVEQLVRSLGINCKLWEAKKAGYKNKDGEFIRCKDSYKLSIRTTVPIFKLERKLNNYNFSDNLKKKSMEELTSILSIEKVENDYSTCIKVDNKDSLFLTNNFIVTHNCGKYPFQASWEAVEPALKGKNGYRSAPYFSWTGGDTEKAKEAFKFTLNPEASNLLEFETEGKKTSKVMFATYRQDCKIKVLFTTFLDKENIKYDKKNEDLKSIQIEVSDVEEATRKTLKELEDKKKDKDPLASIKHRAYYPLCLKDILAKETKNNFNKEFIDQQLEYLKDVGYDKVEVFRDIKTGEVKHKFSFAPVIEDWRKPVFLDTPVKIWDFPKHTEYGVHVIGLDSVRENETNSSDSLAYFTVLRRLHSDLEDPFRGKQVASWLGRKKTVKEMLQLLLDVAEWYNAQILYEHVDRSVLDFFESKRKMHLLIDTIPLQKEIAIKTKTKNNKGLRPTVANQQFLLNSTLGWVNEDMEDDSLGYSRIMDEVLLNQLAEYDPEENLDCYIGFSHAVAAYNYFEKFGVPEVPNSNKEQITSNKKPVIYNAFGIPFNKKSKSVFGF